MRGILFIVIFFALIASVYFYVFQNWKTLFESRFYPVIYWSSVILWGICCFLSVYLLQSIQGVRPVWMNIIIGLMFSYMVVHLLLAFGFLVYDVFRFIAGVSKRIVASDSGGFLPKRRKLVIGGITTIAALPFSAMLFGITRGKYNYKVIEVDIPIKNLPDNFEGFKIVQISDIHSGSYDSIHQVELGVNMINELDPGIIVFTGDLVNSLKDEINPYIETFAKLKAKLGKFSITGNHDYYGMGNLSSDQRKTYWEDFKSKHKQMGFDLILNDHRSIKIDDHEISLLGVENWGKDFSQYGDLDQALKNCPEKNVRILLSHDPTHWDEKTIPNPRFIDLTLSGHTHGMQFGINALGIKWSPVKYRYKKWAGLYENQDQKLYINRGFGFLGFPGRVGMWPEITQLTLRKA